jgi:membrane protein
MLKEFWTLAKQSFAEWNEDKASRLAAAVAYYTMLSIAPLLIISIKIIGVVFGDEAARGGISRYLTQTVGSKGAAAAQEMIKHAGQNGAGVMATIISTAILLFSASGVFGELQDALNTIWEVKPKPDRKWTDMIRERFFSFGLVLGVVFLLLVTLIINTVLSALTNVVGGEQVIWQIVNFVISFAVIVCLFALIFRYLPDAEVRWRYVWTGAIVTGLLFTIGKFLLAFYLGRASTVSVYGAAGSLVALLIWVYYSAQILFFGAEFTQVYAKQHGQGIRPADNAVAMTEIERAQRGMPHKEALQIAARRKPVGNLNIPDNGHSNPWVLGTIGLAAGAGIGGIATWLAARRPKASPHLDKEMMSSLHDRVKQVRKEVATIRNFDKRARARQMAERLALVEQRVYEAVKSNAAPSTPKVLMDRFVQGWRQGTR